MDLKEFMSFAPPGCGPKVISRASIIAEGAKRRGKKPEEMTKEEIEEEMEMYQKACFTPADMMCD